MGYTIGEYRTASKGVRVLNLVLTEVLCKECKARLSEYEIENNDSYCMDCYKEIDENK